MIENPRKLSNPDINDKIINEVIHGKVAQTPKGALKTVLSGKRDVGFVELNKENSIKIIKHNIGVIPVRMTSHNTIMSIIYRDYAKALKLYEITKRKNGYLTDGSPIEAREIGRLLGYSEESIEEYIKQKYGTKVPILPEKTPEDFDDLAEQNFPAFEKQIEKDIKGGGLDKKFIIQLGDAKVYAVNADFVRDTDPGLGFNGFTDGGSYYVTSLPGYKKWIPEDEIWIDDVFLSKPNDFGAFILHELLERHLMKYYGVPYDTAHSDYAEKAEPMFREKVKEGVGLDMIEKIYDSFVHRYAEHHKMKKLNENYQFSKIKELMKVLNTNLLSIFV